jgi:hypothetical protein
VARGPFEVPGLVFDHLTAVLVLVVCGVGTSSRCSPRGTSRTTRAWAGSSASSR